MCRTPIIKPSFIGLLAKEAQLHSFFRAIELGQHQKLAAQDRKVLLSPTQKLKVKPILDSINFRSSIYIGLATKMPVKKFAIWVNTANSVAKVG